MLKLCLYELQAGGGGVGVEQENINVDVLNLFFFHDRSFSAGTCHLHSPHILYLKGKLGLKGNLCTYQKSRKRELSTSA
jgi:hypothetical protein